MTKIYLSGGGASIVFPVSPAEISESRTQLHNKYTTIGKGQVLFIGQLELRKVDFSGIFPSNPVVGYSADSNDSPDSYCKSVESMRESREVLHLTITGEKALAMDCMITDFDCSLRKGKDIYYTISFLEYRGIT